jgi:uncharacterized membrane protein
MDSAARYGPGMLLAAIRDTPYNIVLFLHILTVIIGLAPAVVFPIVGVMMKDGDPAARLAMYAKFASSGQRIFANSLIVAGLLGFALVGMSDSGIEMSETWISLSILIWIALIGVLHGLIIPTQRAVSEGDSAAEAKLTKIGPIFHLLALVMLYLMVFRPGGQF